MPTYDYRCAACGHRFEVVHGVHSVGPETCTACGGGPVRKAVVAPTVVFKGSGWAKVDRRSGGGTKPSTSDEGAGGATSEPGKGESAKPAAESAPKAGAKSQGSETGSAPAAATSD